GLTAQAHRDSLSQDVLARSWGEGEALRRLLFYYPEAGEPLALKLLARPRYKHLPVYEFIEGRLLKEEDPARRGSRVGEVRGGQAGAEGLPRAWRRFIDRSSDPPEREHDARLAATAGEILKRLYPGYDPRCPPFVNAATAYEQAELTESLAACPGEALDRAVL